jgi:hypothetical protein
VRTSSTLSLVVVSLEAPRTLSALKNARRPCFCKILSAVIASNTSVYCPFTRYRRQGRRGERGEEGKHARTPEHTTHEHTHTHTGQQKHAEVSKQVARKTEDGTGKAVVAAALVCPDSHVEAVHRTFTEHKISDQLALRHPSSGCSLPDEQCPRRRGHGAEQDALTSCGWPASRRRSCAVYLCYDPPAHLAAVVSYLGPC